MLRVVCMSLLILINFVLQSTLFQSFAILGVIPDTALILIVSAGILRGDIEGAIFGFFAGLVHDLFGGYYIGLYAMLGFLTGYVSGKPFRDFFHDNYFLPFFMVVAAAAAHQFLFYCCGFLFTGKIDMLYYVRSIILPKTNYTASLAIPVYSLMHAINARIERYERSRRSLFKPT
ncbi:MAG: rod shape-determining protein MreD [Clostridiales bacterium]|nr:rod shape-determining protein MreD [Clostridiales bacterium]